MLAPRWRNQGLGCLSTKAGEGALVAGVQGGVLAGAATTLSTTTSAALTASATLTTASARATTATTATVTSVASVTTTGTVLLLEAVVDVDNGLLLALTLALGLATATGEEILSILLEEWLGGGPLLVGLAALVGLADLKLAKSKLLLSLLGEVVLVGDVLVLRLARGLETFGILSDSLLQFGLGDLLAGLLILLLGLTLLGTPRLGSLLLGTA